MALHNKIGVAGEELAKMWLPGKGFVVIEQNYRKKYGEIDIVARGTSKIIHFIEVKTVSYGTKMELEHAVTHETWRPEEMLHRKKQERFKRVIQTWLLERKYKEEWQIDLVTVRIVPREKYARIKLFENLIFE